MLGMGSTFSALQGDLIVDHMSLSCLQLRTFLEQTLEACGPIEWRPLRFESAFQRGLRQVRRAEESGQMLPVSRVAIFQAAQLDLRVILRDLGITHPPGWPGPC